ncbi:unnamed protein product, partial [Ectocarpus sp. 12 AP-2014]
MSSGDNGVSNDSGKNAELARSPEVADITVAVKVRLACDCGEQFGHMNSEGEEQEEQKQEEREEGHEREDISRTSLRLRQAAAISEH